LHDPIAAAVGGSSRVAARTADYLVLRHVPEIVHNPHRESRSRCRIRRTRRATRAEDQLTRRSRVRGSAARCGPIPCPRHSNIEGSARVQAAVFQNPHVRIRRCLIKLHRFMYSMIKARITFLFGQSAETNFHTGKLIALLHIKCEGDRLWRG